MAWILSAPLIQDFVNSLSSREEVEAFLVANSLDGELSLPLNGSHQHLAFWSPDKMMEVCPRSPSGMTFKPLTESAGAALLTWYLADSLAKTSALPAKVLGFPVLAQDFGRTWRALFGKYDRDTGLWKTRPSLWDEGLTQSLPTLPRWGSMLDGQLWERMTLVRRTEGTEYGSLPTPVKYDSHGTWESNNYHGLGWLAKHQWSKLCDVDLCKNEDEELSDLHGTGTDDVKKSSRMWPTPMKSDVWFSKFTLEMSYKHFTEGRQVHLAQVVRDSRMWPTITKTQIKVPVKSLIARMNEGKRQSLAGVPLVEAIQRETMNKESWPTPMCTGLRGGSGVPKDLDERLNAQTLASQTQGFPTPTAKNGLRSSSASPHHPGKWQHPHHPGKWQHPGHPEFGELNPEWVEWLMNWPIGWTSYDAIHPSAVASWVELTLRVDEHMNIALWWVTDPSSVEGGIPRTVPQGSPLENSIREARISALGNGQVPSVVAAVWTQLWDREDPPIY